MKNKELQAVLSTLPDDIEIGLGCWGKELLSVRIVNMSENCIDRTFIKFYDDQGDLSDDLRFKTP